MTDPWVALASDLPLSRTEREVVRRFEAEPLGRTFLPLADILRAHRHQDESLELLMAGVERHPSFSVARVVLVRELLGKGLIGEAWRILASAPTSLKDNLLAQKLRLRLAILRGDAEAARATYQHLQVHQMLDGESKRIGNLFEVSGIETARQQLLKEIVDRGVEPVLDAPPLATPPPADALPSTPSIPANGMAPAADLSESSAFPDSGAGNVSVFFRADRLDDDPRLAAFHVVPLGEILGPADSGGPGRAGGGDGIALDSSTLADIYARQGHYGKALTVYRRLLREAPNSDLLKLKVAELIKLEREQVHADLIVDPQLVDRLESVEIIDRQIRFYNDLLARLT